MFTTTTTESGIATKRATRLPRPRMKALLKEGSHVGVQLVSYPSLTDTKSVVIRVLMAGLCRTDIYAAEGKIKTCEPLVLGHEFSGVIEELGSDVDGLKIGQRVTVNPVMPCRNCQYCGSGQSEYCQKSTFLGVDRCGCFAEFVTVPAATIIPLPDGISDLAAAYSEPVAATLAVLKAGIENSQKGLIYGNNRFSHLVKQILNVKDHHNITVYDPATEGPIQDDGTYDYVIETIMNHQSLSDMVKAIKPNGKIILKSRQYEPIPFKMTDMLKKEPVIHIVNYGSFEDAIDLLATGKIDVEALVDGIYDLEDYSKVMAQAKQQESLKPFFAPGGSH